MVGGTLQPRNANPPQKDESFVRFDLTITIDLKQMESNELNDVVEGVAGLIAPSLGQGRASCHINVEPVGLKSSIDSRNADEVKAA
jgi:hypothetical protein